MESTFTDVFKEASALIESGINVIPVRDKDEDNGTKIYPKKSPFYGWKQWQTNRISVAQFYQYLENSKSLWIAIVLGNISKRTICIDIDNKHWEGVEHKLFSAIKELYPHIWKKLRVHQSQSGGYHIFFSVPESMPVPKSKKLAYKTGEKEAGIELKAEGGIVVIPPSNGYSIIQNVPITELTTQEISVIFAIIEDINEKKKIVVEKISRDVREDNYYSTNPFDDFNNSFEGEKQIEKYGWQFESENNQFIHFTREGKKGGISATFIKDKRCFHVFTTSDGILEGGVNYSPCGLIQKYENIDGKQLYKQLVERGFGKAKEESEIIKAKRLAASKAEPLNNFSEKAKEVFNQEKNKIISNLPFGEYWKTNSKGEYVVSRSKLINVANELGFRLLNDELVQIVDEKFIKNRSLRDFQDELIKYVYCDNPDDYIQILDVIEAFFQKSDKFTTSRLQIIKSDLLLQDDKNNCYKIYKNGIVHITVNSINLIPFSEMDQLIPIWEIIDRDFIPNNKIGKYSEFLEKSCGLDQYTKKILGYLSHNFKDETTGYIIILTEKVIDPKNGGGSGKNVFCNLLKLTTSVCNTNGAQLQFDEKFLQSWDGQRIMSLSDVPKDFPISFLKEASTGTMKWRRLFKNPIDLEVHQTPKYIIQTNYSYEIADGGVKRRVIPLEFSNFFTLKGGIDNYFGCHFPKGWNDIDWMDFDNVICSSIQEWIKSECTLKPRELSSDGWTKQFRINFGETIVGIIDENFDNWMSNHEVSKNTFLDDIYRYYKENDVNPRYHPSVKKINEALTEWCAYKNIYFRKDYVKKINSISIRYYLFGEKPKEIDCPF